MDMAIAFAALVEKNIGNCGEAPSDYPEITRWPRKKDSNPSLCRILPIPSTNTLKKDCPESFEDSGQLCLDSIGLNFKTP